MINMVRRGRGDDYVYVKMFDTKPFNLPKSKLGNNTTYK